MGELQSGGTSSVLRQALRRRLTSGKVTWHIFIDWFSANTRLTRVRLWANNMRTRGPIGGRHVSPHFWLFGFWFKSSAAVRFEPATSPFAKP
jgi:hypothetical protein